MKSKFVIRCVVLLILINFIVSENVIFSQQLKFNTSSDQAQKLETENENGTYSDSRLSKLKEIALISSIIITRKFEPEKQVEIVCSDKVDMDINIVKNGFKDDQDKFQSKLTWSGDIFFGSLLAIFSFLSFLGNSFVLFVFLFRHRKLSSAEIFFINLAIVDILLSIASYPMSTAAAFRHRWDFGQIGCTIYGFICYFLGLASISSITSIAIIRYFKTCDLVRGNQITCQTSASRMYIILVTIFVALLPLFIIIFCYIQIIRVVRRSNQKLKINGVNKKRTRSDVQLTWISGLITIGFIVTWSPYAIVCLYSSFMGKLMVLIWITSLPTLLAKSAIKLNPIIYIFFTERYRNDLAIEVDG